MLWLGPETPSRLKSGPADSAIHAAARVKAKTRQRVDFESSADWCWQRPARLNGEDYSALDLPGGSTGGRVGDPQLPYHGKFIRVPDGAGVRLVVDETVWTELPGTHRVAPRQPAPSDALGAVQPPFVRNPGSYEADAWTQAQPVEIADRMRIRGREFIYVKYSPLAFHPRRGALRAAGRVRWHLEFDLPPGGAPAPKPDAVGEEAFGRLFETAVDATATESASPQALLPADSPGVTNGADYLIVAHDLFYTNILPLAELKQLSGLQTRVVRLSEITATTNVSEITAFIKNAYDTWTPAPTYLLLVGDAPQLPPHDARSHPDREGMPATDLYYSTVDGADVFPDLFCGRLPCATPTECANMVAKIVQHQCSPDPTPSYRQSALTAGYFQDSEYTMTPGVYADPPDGYEARIFVETAEAARNFLVSQGFTVYGSYVAETNLVPRRHCRYLYGSLVHTNGSEYLGGPAYAPHTEASAEVRRRLNEGVWLALHRDHASAFGWGDPSFSNGDARAMTNGARLPIVFSINCQSGWFDLPGSQNSLCEEFIKKAGGGAVGAICATRNSASWWNDWFCHGLFESLFPGYLGTLSTLPGYKPGLAYGDNAVHRGDRLGQTLNFAKMLLYDRLASGQHDGDFRYASEIFHLFGDPAMRARPWLDNPLQVAHPSAIMEGDVSFTVTVSNGPNPVASALVRVTSDQGDAAEALTGGLGRAQFSFPGMGMRLLTVRVTKTNTLPYIGFINITRGTRPLVVTAPTNLWEGFADFTVTVTDGTNNLSGASVRVSSTAGDDLTRTTAAGGWVRFAFDLRTTQQLRLEVSRLGYADFTQTIPIRLGSFEWGPIPSPRQQGVLFNTELTLRAGNGLAVSNFSGPASLAAVVQGLRPTVVLTGFILGRSGSYWRGLQIQNATEQPVDVAGWRVVLGDNPTNINLCNATVKVLANSMAAGAFVGWTDMLGNLWGSPIGWTVTQPGWAMILDSDFKIVDFAAWGWDSEAIGAMAPVVEGHVVSVAGAWRGDGIPLPVSNLDLTRQGSEDWNAAEDFRERAINVTIQNANITLPFVTSEAPLLFEPAVTGSFSNGVWRGQVAVMELASNAVLRAVAGAREGDSGPFTVITSAVHHFSFSSVASPQYWESPFAVTVTAENSSSNVVSSFQGAVALYGVQDAPAPRLVVTELGLGEPDYVELQNVAAASVNTRNWRILIGDDPENIDRINREVKLLPDSVAAKQVLLTSDDAGSSNYWGGPIQWSNSLSGWVMVLDASLNIVDFVAWGWGQEAIAAMAPVHSGRTLRVGGQWLGRGVPFPTRVLGSLQRGGSLDCNRANDFAWRFPSSPGSKNALLTTPMLGARGPVEIEPALTGQFTNGVWSGNVTVRQGVTNMYLEAMDAAGHYGDSGRFDCLYLGQLSLSVPGSVMETSGVLTNQGLVTLPAPRLLNTVVTLTSSHKREVTVPSTVTVLGPHATSRQFDLTVLDDSLVDLGQIVTITASARGYSNAQAQMLVLDNEAPTVDLRLPGAVSEGDGVRLNAGQITLTSPLTEPVAFTLGSSDTTELQVAPTLVFPAGTNRARFDLTVMEDTIPDGTQAVQVVVSAPGLLGSTGLVQVLDNDPHHFSFGSLAATQTVLAGFPVTLTAADASGLPVRAYKGPAALSAESPAGSLSMQPDSIGAFTNGIWAGLVSVGELARNVVLKARDAGAEGESSAFEVASGPLHHFAWDPLPLSAHAGAWLPARIVARDANEFPVTAFSGPVSVNATRHAPGHPVRLLTFVGYANPQPEHSNTLAAIRRHFTDFEETPFGLTDPAELANALDKNDVFLILAQDRASSEELARLGSDWAAALQSYVNSGGVVIVCSGRNDEHRLLQQAGLAQVQRESLGEESPDNSLLVSALTNRLTAGLPPQFDGRRVSGYSSPNCQAPVRNWTNSVPVVLSRQLGQGQVVLLGNAFSEAGLELDRVLANALRLGVKRIADPAPLAPVAVGPFADGEWTGHLAVGMEGLDFLLSVTDGAGHTNESGFFDVTPLRMALQPHSEAGSLLLRWESVGATRYTVESSPTLLPASFAPVASNLLATPPANTFTGRVDAANRVFYRIRVQAP